MCNAKAVAIVGIAALGAATGGFGLLAAAPELAVAGTGLSATAGGITGLTATAAGTGLAAGSATAIGSGIGAGLTAGATATTGMTALQTAALYSSMAGAGLSAYGQYQGAQAAKDAANYNAKVAEMQAADARDRGVYEQEALGRKIGQMRGQQRANMAANGLDLTDGTPAALLDQTDYYGLEDQRTLANNINREAAGYGTRANLARAQADGYDPAMSASASLLTNAGTVADRWYKYRG